MKTIECFGLRDGTPVFVLVWELTNDGLNLEFGAFTVVGDVSQRGDMELEIDDGRGGSDLSTVVFERTYDERGVVEDAHTVPVPGISGYVKWDGCCNVHTQPDHYCNPGELQDVCALLLHCYELAREHIARWDGGKAMKTTTTTRTVADLVEAKEDAPLPLAVIPNHMGINLCSVESLSWTRREDGQLVDLTIHFIPEDG